MEKKVLLFSGGFDSTLQEFLISPDVLLYVDMKTSYSEVEIAFLKTLPKHYQDRLLIKELPIGEYERESKYLPYRNLLLLTIAMQYGQHVYLGLNASDDAPDKDDTFIKRTMTLFRHLNSNCEADMGWESKNFSFLVPFRDLTKSEMVKEVIERGMPIPKVQQIRSCYDSKSHKGCGKCRPCLNKAVALVNNNIFDPELFEERITSKSIQSLQKEVLERIKYGGKLPVKYVEEVKRARGLLR